MIWAGSIRDMSNPKLVGQPDTYDGENWNFGSDDNGGVHTNSGVGNFMFYLLVTGEVVRMMPGIATM
jgi:Zn-dependent metalloprotease